MRPTLHWPWKLPQQRDETTDPGHQTAAAARDIAGRAACGECDSGRGGRQLRCARHPGQAGAQTPANTRGPNLVQWMRDRRDAGRVENALRSRSSSIRSSPNQSAKKASNQSRAGQTTPGRQETGRFCLACRSRAKVNSFPLGARLQTTR